MLVEGGSPDVGIVARAVRTSPRTLQRRLQEAGVTFAGVLRQARCVAAEEMLGDPRRKIGDVARVLGYSDPAHFTRAFVRWTGITPRDFRRRLQNDATQRRRRRTLSVR
jgi:AraC-like DNA-binding protein